MKTLALSHRTHRPCGRRPFGEERRDFERLPPWPCAPAWCQAAEPQRHRHGRGEPSTRWEALNSYAVTAARNPPRRPRQHDVQRLRYRRDAADHRPVQTAGTRRWNSSAAARRLRRLCDRQVLHAARSRRRARAGAARVRFLLPGTPRRWALRRPRNAPTSSCSSTSTSATATRWCWTRCRRSCRCPSAKTCTWCSSSAPTATTPRRCRSRWSPAAPSTA